MESRCNPKLAQAYKSRSQIARVVTEHWAASNLFCAACSSDSLNLAAANTAAHDLTCPTCAERYQLKSMRTWNDYRVLDSGHRAMVSAIRSDATPNLLLMHYAASWDIERVLLIPRFFFTESVIEKRKPLAATARRAGWVGCNILIGEIPPEGKIAVITERNCVPPSEVRRQYQKASGLQNLPVSLRGWALDVLRCVRKLPKKFALADLYGLENELSRLHPENRHVKDKIRQQLQVLRDLGLVSFRGAGTYESTA